MAESESDRSSSKVSPRVFFFFLREKGVVVSVLG